MACRKAARTRPGERPDNEGAVEFIAGFIGPHEAERHHERSLFKKIRGIWFYAEALR